MEVSFSYNRTTGRLSHASEKLAVGRHAVRITAEDTLGLKVTKAWGVKVPRR